MKRIVYSLFLMISLPAPTVKAQHVGALVVTPSSSPSPTLSALPSGPANGFIDVIYTEDSINNYDLTLLDANNNPIAGPPVNLGLNESTQRFPLVQNDGVTPYSLAQLGTLVLSSSDGITQYRIYATTPDPNNAQYPDGYVHIIKNIIGQGNQPIAIQHTVFDYTRLFNDLLAQAKQAYTLPQVWGSTQEYSGFGIEGSSEFGPGPNQMHVAIPYQTTQNWHIPSITIDQNGVRVDGFTGYESDQAQLCNVPVGKPSEAVGICLQTFQPQPAATASYQPIPMGAIYTPEATQQDPCCQSSVAGMMPPISGCTPPTTPATCPLNPYIQVIPLSV